MKDAAVNLKNLENHHLTSLTDVRWAIFLGLLIFYFFLKCILLRVHWKLGTVGKSLFISFGHNYSINFSN